MVDYYLRIQFGVKITRLEKTALTLFIWVSPLINHSLVSAGDSTAVELAASANSSLIMLTVNSFVERILFRVSLGRRGDRLKDTLTKGGLWETYKDVECSKLRL